jgi:hypothetical protein
MKACALLALAFLGFGGPALAQAPSPAGTLVVTVVDTTGAVLPGATVTIRGLDANNKTPIDPITATDQGIATAPKLAPGRYSVTAEFAGFETRMIPEVRVRNGNNKQVVMLPIEGHKETVQVSQDKTAAASDRGNTFGTTLTREQLENLSDDPETLRQQLLDMAGPGAVIKVDSFEGGALPAKSQIRSIRISRDQFAAEHHSAGGINIEIITQPGQGPVRMNLGYRMLGDNLTGTSPFVTERGPESNQNLNLGVFGTLVKNKSSFNIFLNGVNQSTTPNINAININGDNRSEAARIQQRTEGFNVNANVDYAVTIDQTLRFALAVNTNNTDNLGIGQWDYEERAYQRDSANGYFRMQQIGPLGRRAFLRTRFQFAWTDTTNESRLEAQTIRVNDSFTRGGAQVAGGQHARTGVFASDLDYVRGSHTYRTGIQIDASKWDSDDRSNYLGTYTFESFEQFEAGTPRSYTRRIGDPDIKYNYFQGSIYAQDDIRVRRNLTMSAGVRYEAQAHLNDYDNVMPRFGVTYAPGAQGTMTLRASWGIFHDWVSQNTYEQTLRVDGFHQKEVDLANPPYPDFNDLVLLAAPGNKYVWGDDVAMSKTNRLSLAIDRRFKVIQASATYAYSRGGGIARGDNLNAPVNGVRPDPNFGNIIEVVSDASSRLHELQTNLTINQGALFPVNKAAPFVSFKRSTLFLNYTIANNRNNSDGAFSVAPSGDQDAEWGPSNNDVRHRLGINFNNQIIKNLGVGLGFNITSGTPYTIRTGLDDNGDLIYNDRPDAVGRNTLRAAGRFNMNLNVNYNWQFGPPAGGPPGIGVMVNGGNAEVRTFDAPSRFRIGVFLFAQNVTNHANYTGYSGTMTSQFFMQPTAVAQTRRVEAGVNFGF